MGIAVKVISAILKSVASNKIGNEFGNEIAGIFIDEVTGKGIDKIKDFINEGKVKIERILSKENMESMNIPEDNIDYVVAEIKDLFFRIDITDEVFKQCEYDSMNLSAFLWDEYCKLKNGYVEYQSYIRQSIFSVAETLNKLIRESKNFEKNLMIQMSNSIDDSNTAIQNISNYIKENFSKLDENSQMILNILQIILEQVQSDNLQNKKIQKKIESRTQEYADKWNANMFLNDFDKRDENAGVNVELSDVYIDFHLPHYIYGENEIESVDLKELLTEHIDNRYGNQMLLILGHPGIGKSTLITWMTANFKDRVDDIFIYRFASDLKNIEWEKDDISKRILENLNLSYSDLDGKVLIIDGYDEINVKDRRKVLEQLYWGLVKEKNIHNYTLIVTCRVNYIQEFKKLRCKYITLQPWNEEQIKSFCNVFQEKTNYEVSEYTIRNLLCNKEIFGIPLILYMVLALKISIEKESSVVEIYDKIFALDGGIYDRCIGNKSFAEPHRISKSEIKKQIHQMSREIAMWMFENNFEEACISKKEYQKICLSVICESGQENQDIDRDFMIGNFFRLKHCEGRDSNELLFVHRSIFEYFVVEYIYSSICEAIDLSKEDVAGVLGKFLAGNILSHNMLEYFKVKILNGTLRDKFEIINDAFQLMLQDGMTYHTNDIFKIYYKNVMDCEMKVFANMLEIMHLWNVKKIKFDNKVTNYLRYNINNDINMNKVNISRLCLNGVNLNGVNLRGADLTGVDLKDSNLKNADLRESNLKDANLEKSSLRESNLKGANLKGVNLREADLREVNLIGANLHEANLRRANLRRANLEGANLEGANLEEADLYASNMEESNLIGTDLYASNLQRAYLNEANLENALLDEFNIKYLENKYNLKLTKVCDISMHDIITYGEYCKRKHRD